MVTYHQNERESSVNVELSYPKHGIHPWLMGAARRLRNAGTNDEEAFHTLRELTRNARRNVPDHEIEKTVNRVFETELDHSKPYRPRQTFAASVLKKFAARAPEVNANFFKRVSPLPTNLSPAFALAKLFRPKEKVLIFDKYQSQGQHLWSHTTQDLSFPSWLINNKGRGSDKNGICSCVRRLTAAGTPTLARAEKSHAEARNRALAFRISCSNRTKRPKSYGCACLYSCRCRSP